jgi:plasmid stabilization system protein ParE
MSRRLVVLAEARGDITEASDWYHARSPVAAARFRAEVRRCLDRIRENPSRYQRVHAEARAALLDRFPYALIFVAENPDTLVVACVHQRRDPEEWRERIR